MAKSNSKSYRIENMLLFQNYTFSKATMQNMCYFSYPVMCLTEGIPSWGHIEYNNNQAFGPIGPCQRKGYISRHYRRTPRV